MKNLSTPRTLADCQFTSGYPIAPSRASMAEDIADYVLAVVIGVALAAVTVVWWSV